MTTIWQERLHEETISLEKKLESYTEQTQKLGEEVLDLERDINKLREEINDYEERVSNNPSYADIVMFPDEDDEPEMVWTHHNDYDQNKRKLREGMLDLHKTKLRYAQEKLFAYYENEQDFLIFDDIQICELIQKLNDEIKKEQQILQASKTNWSDSDGGGEKRWGFNNASVENRVVEKQKRVVAKQSMTSNMQHIASVMEQLHKRVSRLEAVSVHKH